MEEQRFLHYGRTEKGPGALLVFPLSVSRGDYRVEKWKCRSAWVQLCQIGNEAAECYCFFLYCINGQFIPRKDWVTYLTYELPDKAPDHERLLESIYTSNPTEEAVDVRFKRLNEAFSWMNIYCRDRKWIS
jgi:hypothetical protein